MTSIYQVFVITVQQYYDSTTVVLIVTRFAVYRKAVVVIAAFFSTDIHCRPKCSTWALNEGLLRVQSAASCSYHRLQRKTRDSVLSAWIGRAIASTAIITCNRTQWTLKVFGLVLQLQYDIRIFIYINYNRFLYSKRSVNCT